MVLVVLLVLSCLVFLLWSWLKPRHKLPPVYPGAFPLIGHSYKWIFNNETSFWELETKIYKFCTQNGGVAVTFLGPVPLYVITDPEDGLFIANTCLDKAFVYKFGKEMFNNGLVTADPVVWKGHRKLLNPAFNQQVLNTFTDDFSVQAKHFVSLVAKEANKGSFDLQPYLEYHVLKTACRTSLGTKTQVQSEVITRYTHANADLFTLYHQRAKLFWLHFDCIFNWTSYKKKQDSLMNVLKSITTSVIKARKLEIKTINNSLDYDKEPTSEKFTPLLDQMLNLADKQDAFTEDEIREHLDTILVANYDTTATALTLIFIVIGSYPDVQRRIFEELQEVFGDEERDLDRHDQSKLVYLEAVIKESLRLYPPTPKIARTSHEDIKLKNYTLPANQLYLISLYGINRHSMWGEDVDEFKPERWLDPASLPANSNAFAAFSLGRRNCIGKLYAMMSMKTTIAYMLRKYRISSDISKLKMKCDLLMKPVSGHHIKLELRT